MIDVHILLFLDPKKAGLNALGPARMGFRRFMKKRNTIFALTWLLTTPPPPLPHLSLSLWLSDCMSRKSNAYKFIGFQVVCKYEWKTGESG